MTRLLPTLCALLLCLFAGTEAAHAAAPPPTFFGLETKDTFYGSATYQAQNLDRQREIGVGLIRQLFVWEDIESTKGVYNWARHDTFMAETAKRGIEVMPILFGEPTWASSRPSNGGNNGTYPPKVNSDLGDFGAAVARRYGPNGTFWTANPTIPKRPIPAYQVWNEPHLPAFWPAGPNAAQYTALLKATSTRVKAVDAGAEIVAAGISEAGFQGAIGLRQFIAGMYDAGAKGSFDSLAVHPYSKTVAGVISWVDAAKQVARDHGDPGVGLRVTEIGWGTGGPPNDIRTTDAGQAANLRELFTTLLSRRTELNLRGVVWYDWHDAPPDIDWWAKYAGLVRLDGTEKPSLAAYGEVARVSVPPPLGAVPSINPPTSAGSLGPKQTALTRLPRKISRRSLLGGVRIAIRCTARCRVSVRLKVTRRRAKASNLRPVLVKLTRSLPAGRSTVLLRPSRRARTRLRSFRRLRATLAVAVRGSDGRTIARGKRAITVSG